MPECELIKLNCISSENTKRWLLLPETRQRTSHLRLLRKSVICAPNLIRSQLENRHLKSGSKRNGTDHNWNWLHLRRYGIDIWTFWKVALFSYIFSFFIKNNIPMCSVNILILFLYIYYCIICLYTSRWGVEWDEMSNFVFKYRSF